jgi:hypothetical protein
MLLIPSQVRNYAADLPHPACLVGCRTSGLSLDCCEYDVFVFGPGTDRVEHVAGHAVEVMHVGRPKDHLVALRDAAVLNDSEEFSLSSALNDVSKEKHDKALSAYGRKELVSSLFCQQKFKLAKGPAAGAMWAKMASYHLVSGTLAVFGARPMPLHELAQARRLDLTADRAEGMQAALECIGIERATRPAIARSMEAVLELKSGDYDRELVRAKMSHLLEKSMLADCYYYAGKIAAEKLAAKSDALLRRYGKLVQLAMDLSSDETQLGRLQKSLFSAAKKGLETTSF